MFRGGDTIYKNSKKIKSLRIAIIGLDGLSPGILAILVNKIRLPNLSKIVKNSYFRVLKSIPPTTMVGWTSIITGVNPAFHGIFGFTKYYINSASHIVSQLYNSYDVRAPRLFEMSALFGLKSIVVNYPLTYPINGLHLINDNMMIISDSLSSPRIQYYPSILKKYSQYFEKFEDLVQRVELMSEGVLKIANDFDWNLLISVFDVPDKFFHIDIMSTLRVEGRVRHVFYIIDRFIGKLKKISDILIIVSDHGLGIYRKWVNPISLLLARGIIPGKYKFSEKLARNILEIIYGSKCSFIIHPFIHKLAVSQIISKNSLFGEETSVDNTEIMVDEINTQDTWIIYFKDPMFREKVYSYLKNYNEFFDVFRLEDFFKGPFLPKIPSLILIPHYQKGIYLSYMKPKLFSKLDFSYRISGSHHPDGVLIAYGKDIKKSINLSKYVTVYDIVPTILSLFGLPIPKKTDGNILPISGRIRKIKRYNYDLMIKLFRIKRIKRY